MAITYSEMITNYSPEGVESRSGVKKGDFTTPYPYYREGRGINLAYDETGRKVDLKLQDYIHHVAGRSLSLTEQLYVDNQMNLISNKALAEMDEALESSRSFFEDWYERQQAINMACDVLNKVVDFTLNWRKPRYWKKMTERGLKPRDLPEAWLAYNFGVKPLVGTFHDSMNVLGKKFPEYRAVGRSRGVINFKHENYEVVQYCSMIYSRSIGCTVTGYNPNTALLNITGLDQPFSSAFSVIPWGWAVDYFFNASQLLSNFEPKHPGVIMSKHWNTEIRDVKFNGRFREYSRTYPRYGWLRSKRRNIYTYGYRPTLEFPLLLGGSKLANLSSAVALSMKKPK